MIKPSVKNISKQQKQVLKYSLIFLVLTISACSSSKLTISPTNGEYAFVSDKSIEYKSFWDAIENLDFNYLSYQILLEDQQRFSEALKSVVDGDINNAVTQLENLYNLSTDSLIKKHSEEILIKLLFFQSNWTKLLELKEKSNNSGLENDLVFYEAFSKSPKESYLFPSHPTITPLYPIFFGSNPVIEVTVNGHRKKFWVDTGAGLSAVASDVAEECKILPIGTEKTTARAGTGKRISIQPAIIDNLQIGELFIKNHPVLIVDKSEMEFRLFGFLRILKIDGIIGWPAIQNMKIEFDYKNKLTTIDKPVIVKTKNRNLFWLGKPMVTVKTSEGLNLNFQLDTGANKTNIHQNILKKITIEGSYSKKTTDWSVGGSERTNSKYFPNLSLILNGNILHFEVIRISAPRGEVFIKLDGRLGIDLAKNHRIVIDNKNGRFELY